MLSENQDDQVDNVSFLILYLYQMKRAMLCSVLDCFQTNADCEINVESSRYFSTCWQIGAEAIGFHSAGSMSKHSESYGVLRRTLRSDHPNYLHS